MLCVVYWSMRNVLDFHLVKYWSCIFFISFFLNNLDSCCFKFLVFRYDCMSQCAYCVLPWDRWMSCPSTLAVAYRTYTGAIRTRRDWCSHLYNTIFDMFILLLRFLRIFSFFIWFDRTDIKRDMRKIVFQ